jgi:hypothetical protein
VAKASKVFFGLKTLNLVVITFYSFALVYVLIRILPQNLYPIAVLVSSFGVYIMATDLGYSGFVYYRTRQRYLQNAASDGSESEVLNLYLGVALLSAAIAAILILVIVDTSLLLRASLALYFLSIVLALPWGLLRKVAAAVDLYLPLEFYEFIRRIVFLALAGAMLLGLPFWIFCLLCLLVWALAFTAVQRMLRRHGVAVGRSSPRAIARHLADNFRNIGRSGALTVIEFLMYNFPYIAIPLVFGDRMLIVPFDIFYKIVRFGAVSYAVSAESFLPPQTHAYYRDDRGGVLRYYYMGLLLGLLPLCAATAILLGFGDRVFTTLLARAGVIDPAMRIDMVIMLAAMLLQNSAGTFLVGTGNYSPLCRLAAITLSLMGVDVLATWQWRLSFDHFMALYVAAYAVHAIFYSGYLFRFLSRPAPTGQARPAT